MSDQPLAAVILAAGLGTRMRSRTPKVLHRLAGVPMIDLLVNSVRDAGIESVYVVANPQHTEVIDHLDGMVHVVPQREQQGSGHALAQVPKDVLERGDVLVLNGDSPLLRSETIRRIADAHRARGAVATLTTVEDASRSDGRVITRPDGSFERILEARDASPEELARNREINVGAYCFRGRELVQALAQLRPDNAAGELYLTDVFRHLSPVQVVRLEDAGEAIGINDRVQLARAERILRDRLTDQLMRAGVTFVDPSSCFVDAAVKVGADTVIEPFTMLRGATTIGENCRIGPFADIRDSSIGAGARVEHSWLDRVEFGEGSDCGPFVKLRPGTRIGPRVHIGSFAELVRSSVGEGSAVPHLSYLGDTTVGENVNVGAGTITANYDGQHKNATVIEDDCFIGVDTMFVAPRRMGRGSRTGAGAVVTKDVPPDSIAVGVPARMLRRTPDDDR